MLPKIAIFEEAGRNLEIPGGVRMIQEYYRQMRKFGCNILAVARQYDVLKAFDVIGAMIGNSRIFLKLKSPSTLKMLAGFLSDLAWMADRLESSAIRRSLLGPRSNRILDASDLG
jgi:hypothetical protein